MKEYWYTWERESCGWQVLAVGPLAVVFGVMMHTIVMWALGL